MSTYFLHKGHWEGSHVCLFQRQEKQVRGSQDYLLCEKLKECQCQSFKWVKRA
jgi:hypothetical protein